MDGERPACDDVRCHDANTLPHSSATISIDASISDIGAGPNSPPFAARQTADHAPRLRRRAPPPERDVRAAVRDPEPVRLRARVRRGRRARAAARWASTSRRTAPPPRPAPSAATCSRASPAAASARSCSARTSTPCPRTASIEPVLDDGGWVSAGDTILGADNKAAVAVILEVARRCAVEGSPVGLELLFTVSEENALAGAKAFDVTTLRSDWGYVFDHASPIGEIIVASPTYYRFEAELPRHAAHAGIRPEDGRSAIEAAARAIGAMRARAHRRGDDGERRRDRGRPARRHEHRRRALPDRGGGALAGPGARPRTIDRRAHRPHPRRRQHARAAPATSTSRPSGSSTATATPPNAPAVLAAEEALRACGYSADAALDRRRLGRQRVRGRRACTARTSPTAPSATTSPTSASASPRSRACST